MDRMFLPIFNLFSRRLRRFVINNARPIYVPTSTINSAVIFKARFLMLSFSAGFYIEDAWLYLESYEFMQPISNHKL